MIAVGQTAKLLVKNGNGNSMFLINKKAGPKKLSWGTSLLTGADSELNSLTFMNCMQFDKKSVIQLLVRTL